MTDSPSNTRLLTSLTFRCCSCGNRTGMAEAFIREDDGDLCCSRCAGSNEIDELQMLVLVES
jgi:hypothetical protein